MGTIGKIREQKVLLLVVVGLGMLLFIIPFDQIMNWGGGRSNAVGEVNGVEIDPEAWGVNQRVSRIMASNPNVTEQQAREYAISKMVQDTLWNTQLRQVGFVTADDELNAVIYGDDGVAVADYVQELPYFQDKNRQFSLDSLNSILPRITANDPAFWKQHEDAILVQNARSKYAKLIGMGVIATDVEMDRYFHDTKDMVSYNYTYQAYADVPDSVATYTDEELKTFYNEHKDDGEFEVKEFRAFDFVSIDVIPSSKDTADLMEKMDKLADKFKAKEAAQDSLFITSNSETPYAKENYRAGVLPASIDTLVAKGTNGVVYGPYFDVQTQKYRVLKTYAYYEQEPSVRHILINANAQQPGMIAFAKQRADSIADALRAGANFESLVKFSQDPGKTENGGYYEWFKRGAMVPPFENYAYNNPKGSIGVVQTQYGFHVMEIVDKRNAEAMTIKNIFLDKTLKPSDATVKSYRVGTVYDLTLAAQEGADFNAFAKANNLEVKSENAIAADNPRLYSPELNDNFQIKKWAFNATVGKVSDNFYNSKNHNFIIAKLTADVPRGAPSFESAKIVMKQKMLNMKKAAYIREKIASATTLEAATIELGTANEVGNSSLSMSYIGSAQGEDKTLGELFTVPAGEMRIIDGNTGVFVFKVNEYKPAVVDANTDITVNKFTIESGVRKEISDKLNQSLYIDAKYVNTTKKNELQN